MTLDANAAEPLSNLLEQRLLANSVLKAGYN